MHSSGSRFNQDIDHHLVTYNSYVTLDLTPIKLVARLSFRTLSGFTCKQENRSTMSARAGAAFMCP